MNKVIKFSASLNKCNLNNKIYFQLFLIMNIKYLKTTIRCYFLKEIKEVK